VSPFRKIVESDLQDIESAQEKLRPLVATTAAAIWTAAAAMEIRM
jgi:hypothetical protein